MTIESRKTLSTFLLNEILSGNMPAGSKLPPERELSVKFELSRPIVREVLRSLAERGFVDIQPSRGTFVREATPADGVESLDTSFRRRGATVREVIEARSMLETHAAALAAAHATDAEVVHIRRLLDEFGTGRHVVERARADLAFHTAIVRAGHNTVIETMYASISDLAYDLMLRSLSSMTIRPTIGPAVMGSPTGTPVHDAIWVAIRDRDPERAGRAMRHHFEAARRHFGSDYDRSVNEVLPR